MLKRRHTYKYSMYDVPFPKKTSGFVQKDIPLDQLTSLLILEMAGGIKVTRKIPTVYYKA